MKNNNLEVITIETNFPGKIIGKKVVDSRKKCIGIVRSIELDFSTKETKIIVYVNEGSKDISINEIARIEDRIQLKKPLKGYELQKGDGKKIKRKIRDEINSTFTISSLLTGREKS